MARRVYLHIGAPKTGSTYVQNVLWNNSAALADAGILLPASAAAHDHAMADLRAAPWRDSDAYWTWDRLAEKVRDWPGDAIISNEGLGAATDAQAARAVQSLEAAEVHVIAPAVTCGGRSRPSGSRASGRAAAGGSGPSCAPSRRAGPTPSGTTTPHRPCCAAGATWSPRSTGTW
ncbi:hypothetical protein [Verrucosispora sioxanthis]|uniref:hypothetical protein n=1 Tax=Verrucosispora sioxanthis TaxID=2499994 RepID=UPI00209F98F0|nr:hypothetical protein [Verrucosispora sioxanthis]